MCKVKKGEKGFPVFSRPSKSLKEEQGKNTEGEKSYFYESFRSRNQKNNFKLIYKGRSILTTA